MGGRPEMSFDAPPFVPASRSAVGPPQELQQQPRQQPPPQLEEVPQWALPCIATTQGAAATERMQGGQGLAGFAVSSGLDGYGQAGAAFGQGRQQVTHKRLSPQPQAEQQQAQQCGASQAPAAPAASLGLVPVLVPLGNGLLQTLCLPPAAAAAVSAALANHGGSQMGANPPAAAGAAHLGPFGAPPGGALFGSVEQQLQQQLQQQYLAVESAAMMAGGAALPTAAVFGGGSHCAYSSFDGGFGGLGYELPAGQRRAQLPRGGADAGAAGGFRAGAAASALMGADRQQVQNKRPTGRAARAEPQRGGERSGERGGARARGDRGVSGGCGEAHDGQGAEHSRSSSRSGDGGESRPPMLAEQLSKLGSLANARHLLVEMAEDQMGSRAIQQRLEGASKAEIEALFEAVLPHAVRLFLDVFGNYVMQKLVEVGEERMVCALADKVRGSVVPLALQTYSCRVLQKLLEVAPLSHKLFVVEELATCATKCVRDQNGACRPRLRAPAAARAPRASAGLTHRHARAARSPAAPNRRQPRDPEGVRVRARHVHRRHPRRVPRPRAFPLCALVRLPRAAARSGVRVRRAEGRHTARAYPGARHVQRALLAPWHASRALALLLAVWRWHAASNTDRPALPVSQATGLQSAWPEPVVPAVTTTSRLCAAPLRQTRSRRRPPAPTTGARELALLRPIRQLRDAACRATLPAAAALRRCGRGHLARARVLHPQVRLERGREVPAIRVRRGAGRAHRGAARPRA